MKRCLFLYAFSVLLSPLIAQQSLVDSVPPAKKQKFEIGLNITNTISSLVGSTSNTLTNDPYLVSMRFGGAQKRLRMAFNFRIKNSEEGDFNVAIEKERTFHVRMGYESVHPVARRFAMYWGIDAVFEASKEEVESNFFGGSAILENRLLGFGGGPVLGIQWRAHPRIIFTTESSLYAVYRKGYEKVSAPPDFSNTPKEDFDWQPLIPSSLYVNFVF